MHFVPLQNLNIDIFLDPVQARFFFTTTISIECKGQTPVFQIPEILILKLVDIETMFLTDDMLCIMTCLSFHSILCRL